MSKSPRPLRARGALNSAKWRLVFLLGQGVIWAAPVTFNKDIAPLVFAQCSPCHRPGEYGPFPLLSYQDVRKHASQIAVVTAKRLMPPWPPEPNHGEFSGDRHLTDAQIRLIADWVKQGTPEGNPTDAPAPPRFTQGWQAGAPDLVIRMAQPYHLGTTETDVWRNFIVATGLKETRYVRALELRLDHPQAVHHANIVLDRAQTLRKRDGKDGLPGFPGMDVTTEAAANDFDPDSHFLVWKPGTVPTMEPPDMAWRLDPGTDLILNLHMKPTGKPEAIQAEIGLYFSDKAPTRFPMLVQLEHDGAIDVPAGSSSSVTDELLLPVDVDVLGIYPHAHFLGKVIEAWAMLPDGSRRWLIRIPDWDINWQAVYEYKTPISLPKGTTLAMKITYDNSESNPRNTNHPPKRTVSGNRGEDEMGHIWLQLLPKAQGSEQKDARLAIQEAVMRRRLAKYPADFLGHYNLGAVLQLRGELDEAIVEYQDSLRGEPGNVTARNSLATALIQKDRVPDAIRELRETLRIDPSYANARYNLARMLAESGDAEGAMKEYSTLLEQKPDDADAQAGLGGVYFLQKRYSEAVTHFQAATALDPGNADLQASLGSALALSGNLEGAISAFQRALQLDPGHEVARANLAIALSTLREKSKRLQ
jgi:Flp pilus assembly protein TadD/mono/diheme cytochrome c family protein